MSKVILKTYKIYIIGTHIVKYIYKARDLEKRNLKVKTCSYVNEWIMYFRTPATEQNISHRICTY